MNDRASIERVYPLSVFRSEGNANLRAEATTLRGVTILSPSDAVGSFDLIRAVRHKGEAPDGADAVFLCPFAQATGDEPQRAYDAFIDKVIATARAAAIAPPTGAGDERLQGPRQ